MFIAGVLFTQKYFLAPRITFAIGFIRQIFSNDIPIDFFDVSWCVRDEAIGMLEPFSSSHITIAVTTVPTTVWSE